MYIGITLILGFGAVNTGNNLLYLIVSALLGFMSISGILGNQNIRKIALEIIPPRELYDGVETLLTLTLHNQKRFFHSFLIEVQFQGNQVGKNILLRGETQKITLPVTFTGRGKQTAHTFTIQSNFPINFFKRSRTVSIQCPLLIYPRPEPCLQPITTTELNRGHDATSSDKGYEGDISRIRDYQGSEPLKMIHWKLSAKHDSLKVKELSSTSAVPVVFDPLQLPGLDLEAKLRCASYLINEYLRWNQPVGILLAHARINADIGLHQKYTLLSALALYGKDPISP